MQLWDSTLQILANPLRFSKCNLNPREPVPVVNDQLSIFHAPFMAKNLLNKKRASACCIRCVTNANSYHINRESPLHCSIA
jgi:hypothetical protein